MLESNPAPNSLGISVGTALQVAQQWFDMADLVERLAFDVTAGRRLGGSVYARIQLARGAFASKVFHTFLVQAPPEPAQERALQRLQTTLDQLVFGKFHGVAGATARQPQQDLGLGHLDIARQVHANWACLAKQLADDTPAVWKNIWWANMRSTYKSLCDKDLLLSNCTYRLLMDQAAPSYVQRAALHAWGAHSKGPVRLEYPPVTPRMARAASLAAYDDEPPPEPKPTWQCGARGDLTA